MITAEVGTVVPIATEVMMVTVVVVALVKVAMTKKGMAVVAQI